MTFGGIPLGEYPPPCHRLSTNGPLLRTRCTCIFFFQHLVEYTSLLGRVYIFTEATFLFWYVFKNAIRRTCNTISSLCAKSQLVICAHFRFQIFYFGTSPHHISKHKNFPAGIHFLVNPKVFKGQVIFQKQRFSMSSGYFFLLMICRTSNRWVSQF